MADVPERVRWAVRLIDPKPGDDVLEIGCGNGAALGLIAPLVRTGAVIGVDRSADALRSARKRNGDALKSGRITLVESELSELELRERFRIVFALNVNVFWHRPKKELAAVTDLLAPGGRLYLLFEPPSADQIGEISELCRRNLEANGFSIVDEVRTDLRASAVLAIIAEPAA